MNIIELFDKLELKRDAVAVYTPNDVIRVEKQLNVERRINPEIDANTAANLVSALRDYRHVLVYVLGNRYLYNFITGKDLPRRNFPEYQQELPEEEVKNFIGRFLGDDLELQLDKSLSKDRFASIRELLMASEYIPEETMLRLEKRITGKLEFGIARMQQEGKIDIEAIHYMRLMSFYEVLSHFNSIETDEKIRMVINRTSEMYNANRERKFASDVMICLPSYKAFDEELNRITSGNRNVVSSGPTFSSSGSGSGVSGRVIFFAIIIIIKLVLFGSRCSGNSSYNSGYDLNGGSSGYGYDVLNDNSYQIRINNVKAEQFADYLSMYDKDSVSEVKRVDSIKTGHNPFRTRFTDKIVNLQNHPGTEATITNRSPYDVILLEYAGMSAYNMSSNAYFIKSGHKLTLKVNNTGPIEQDYAFYFGNDLASFYSGQNSIMRNDSLYEFRFMKRAPYCREILGKKFRFSHDVTVTKDGGQLKIKSEGLKGVTDSLDKPDEYIF